MKMNETVVLDIDCQAEENICALRGDTNEVIPRIASVYFLKRVSRVQLWEGEPDRAW